MRSSVHISVLTAMVVASLAACSQEVEDPARPILTQDPQLARSLHDPLMIDPDLAWRNEANAIVTIRDGHPLPPFEASEEARQSAREAARSELLENGQIPALPRFETGQSGVSLANLTRADEIVEAVGARADCIDRMDDDLMWSTAMPPTSSLMPHGMVRQAAGVDVDTCVIRVVRYLVPVSVEDALEYHFTKVDRARFEISLYSSPEAQLIAERRDQKVVVNAREGLGGLTAVDIVHWRK